MQSLKESLKAKLNIKSTGKELVEKLDINKVKLDSPFKVPENTPKEFYMPRYEITEKDECNIIKLIRKPEKIKAPEDAIFIYKDRYHKGLHIASRADIIQMIASIPEDFEDFSQEDIVGTYKTVKEAAIEALKMIGLSQSQINDAIQNMDYKDFQDRYSKKIYKDLCDRPDFLLDAIKGNEANENQGIGLWDEDVVSALKSAWYVEDKYGNKL